MELKEIFQKFPIFKKTDKKRLVYMDTAATSQKPKSVIDAMCDFYSNSNASVHRGVYELSEIATARYEGCREKTKAFINAADSSEIVFTSGTTEGTNFVADAWATNHLKKDDEILLTQVEHHANLLPWQRVAKKTGAKLRFVELDRTSYLLKSIDKNLINKKTKLVAVTQVSNVLGDVWREGQLELLVSEAHKVGAKVLIDAAQSSPHRKIDVTKLGADFLVLSAHKMCGPTGLGVLYIKKSLHEEVDPYQVGGSMIFSVSFESSEWAPPPQKFEAGTPPIAQVIGLDAAIDFFNSEICFDKLRAYEAELCNHMVEELQKIKNVFILGNPDCMKKSGHMAAFTVKCAHSHDIAAMLGMRGVAVRAGHHCAQPLLRLLMLDASVRASLYMYNTHEDVDIFIRELKEIIKVFS